MRVSSELYASRVRDAVSSRRVKRTGSLTSRIYAAGQVVGSRIGSTGLAGRRGRRARREEMIQVEDRIGEVDLAVVIRIR